MARQLLPVHTEPSTVQAGLSAGTLLLCIFALIMCASHSRGWRRWRCCYGSYNDDPVIQLYTEATILKMKGIHKIQPGEDGSGMLGEEREVSVWQKNILMGGKCQLPDFSGVIVYDSAGNLVNPAKSSGVTLSLQ